MKAALEFKGFTQWLEDMTAAEKNIDQAVTQVLNETTPFLKEEIRSNFLQTEQADEEFTGETEATLEVSDVKREGNFIYIEASIGGSNKVEGVIAKEYGNTRQAAEPFFRKTFRSHRIRNRLKENMKRATETLV